MKPYKHQDPIRLVVADVDGTLVTQESGMSIAMGNASKEVQAEANFVTASNEEEGFAQAIERFVLNPTTFPIALPPLREHSIREDQQIPV